MSIRTEFVSPAGGTGCTTFAAAYACLMAEQNQRILITDHQNRGLSDMESMLALPSSVEGIVQVKENLWFSAERPTATERSRYDEVVYDVGTNWSDKSAIGVRRIMVTKPCYIALRRAVSLNMQADAIVLHSQEGRALTDRDVERATGIPVVAVIHTDPVVSRAVDAGLVVHRIPASMKPILNINGG